MKILPRKQKTHRDGQHFYFGELGEVPHAVSIVHATNQEELGTEPRHYSQNGHKYVVVLRGVLEVEVNGQMLVVDPEHCLMVEPKEIHRVVRLIEAPCEFIVFGTVKDPTGADKVVIDE
ncbi:cupin domain-containing protein [Candidatus Berkelbacteria bacterium]|nr:cupin domain-containing protein [Candidatus Berkelbacteria bacterium]